MNYKLLLVVFLAFSILVTASQTIEHQQTKLKWMPQDDTLANTSLLVIWKDISQYPTSAASGTCGDGCTYDYYGYWDGSKANITYSKLNETDTKFAISFEAGKTGDYSLGYRIRDLTEGFQLLEDTNRVNITTEEGNFYYDYSDVTNYSSLIQQTSTGFIHFINLGELAKGDDIWIDPTIVYNTNNNMGAAGFTYPNQHMTFRNSTGNCFLVNANGSSQIDYAYSTDTACTTWSNASLGVGVNAVYYPTGFITSTDNLTILLLTNADNLKLFSSYMGGTSIQQTLTLPLTTPNNLAGGVRLTAEIDKNDIVHIIMLLETSAGVSQRNLTYMNWTPSTGKLSTPLYLWTGQTDVQDARQCFAIHNDGSIEGVMYNLSSDRYQNFTIYTNRSFGWGAEISSQSAFNTNFYPSCALDANDKLHVVVSIYSPSAGKVYYINNTAGNWNGGTFSELTGASTVGNAKLVVNGTQLHILYLNQSTNFYATTKTSYDTGATWTGYSVLSGSGLAPSSGNSYLDVRYSRYPASMNYTSPLNGAIDIQLVNWTGTVSQISYLADSYFFPAPTNIQPYTSEINVSPTSVNSTAATVELNFTCYDADGGSTITSAGTIGTKSGSVWHGAGTLWTAIGNYRNVSVSTAFPAIGGGTAQAWCYDGTVNTTNSTEWLFDYASTSIGASSTVAFQNTTTGDIIHKQHLTITNSGTNSSAFAWNFSYTIPIEVKTWWLINSSSTDCTGTNQSAGTGNVTYWPAGALAGATITQTLCYSSYHMGNGILTPTNSSTHDQYINFSYFVTHNSTISTDVALYVDGVKYVNDTVTANAASLNHTYSNLSSGGHTWYIIQTDNQNTSNYNVSAITAFTITNNNATSTTPTLTPQYVNSTATSISILSTITDSDGAAEVSSCGFYGWKSGVSTQIVGALGTVYTNQVNCTASISFSAIGGISLTAWAKDNFTNTSSTGAGTADYATTSLSSPATVSFANTTTGNLVSKQHLTITNTGTNSTPFAYTFSYVIQSEVADWWLINSSSADCTGTNLTSGTGNSTSWTALANYNSANTQTLCYSKFYMGNSQTTPTNSSTHNQYITFAYSVKYNSTASSDVSLYVDGVKYVNDTATYPSASLSHTYSNLSMGGHSWYITHIDNSNTSNYNVSTPIFFTITNNAATPSTPTLTPQYTNTTETISLLSTITDTDGAGEVSLCGFYGWRSGSAIHVAGSLGTVYGTQVNCTGSTSFTAIGGLSLQAWAKDNYTNTSSVGAGTADYASTSLGSSINTTFNNATGDLTMRKLLTITNTGGNSTAFTYPYWTTIPSAALSWWVIDSDSGACTGANLTNGTGTNASWTATAGLGATHAQTLCYNYHLFNTSQLLPANGTIQHSGDALFSFSANTTIPARAYLFIDGVKYTTSDISSYQVISIIQSLSAGYHSWYSYVNDTSNGSNSVSSEIWNITIGNNNPTAGETNITPQYVNDTATSLSVLATLTDLDGAGDINYCGFTGNRTGATFDLVGALGTIYGNQRNCTATTSFAALGGLHLRAWASDNFTNSSLGVVGSADYAITTLGAENLSYYAGGNKTFNKLLTITNTGANATSFNYSFSSALPAGTNTWWIINAFDSDCQNSINITGIAGATATWDANTSAGATGKQTLCYTHPTVAAGATILSPTMVNSTATPISVNGTCSYVGGGANVTSCGFHGWKSGSAVLVAGTLWGAIGDNRNCSASSDQTFAAIGGLSLQLWCYDGTDNATGTAATADYASTILSQEYNLTFANPILTHSRQLLITNTGGNSTAYSNTFSVNIPYSTDWWVIDSASGLCTEANLTAGNGLTASWTATSLASSSHTQTLCYKEMLWNNSQYTPANLATINGKTTNFTYGTTNNYSVSVKTYIDGVLIFTNTSASGSTIKTNFYTLNYYGTHAWHIVVSDSNNASISQTLGDFSFSNLFTASTNTTWPPSGTTSNNLTTFTLTGMVNSTDTSTAYVFLDGTIIHTQSIAANSLNQLVQTSNITSLFYGLHTWSINVTENASVYTASSPATFTILYNASVNLSAPPDGAILNNNLTNTVVSYYVNSTQASSAKLYVNGALNKTDAIPASSTDYLVQPILTNTGYGVYSWYVVLSDATNASQFITSPTYTFSVVYNASVNLSTPDNGAIINNISNTVLTYYVNASQASTAKLYVNGNLNATAIIPASSVNLIEQPILTSTKYGVYSWYVILSDATNATAFVTSPTYTFSVVYNASVNLSSPSDGSTFGNTTNITLSYFVNASQANNATLWLDGSQMFNDSIPASSSDYLVQHNVSTTVYGLHSWYVTLVDAINASENTISATYTFSNAYNASVALLSPANDTLTYNTTVTLSYNINASELSNATLFINGIEIISDAIPASTTNLNIQHSELLDYGANSWYIVVASITNSSANITSETYYINTTFDVAQISPLDGDSFAGASVNFVYNTTNTAPITCNVTIDGIPAASQVIPTTGTYNDNAILTDGSHTWRVTCYAGSLSVSTGLRTVSVVAGLLNNTINISTMAENVYAIPQVIYYQHPETQDFTVLYFNKNGTDDYVQLKTIVNNALNETHSGLLNHTKQFFVVFRENNQTTILAYSLDNVTQHFIYTNDNYFYIQNVTQPAYTSLSNYFFDPFGYGYTKQYDTLNLNANSYYLFWMPVRLSNGSITSILTTKYAWNNSLNEINRTIIGVAPQWQTVAANSNLTEWYFAMPEESVASPYAAYITLYKWNGSAAQEIASPDYSTHNASSINTSIVNFEQYDDKTYMVISNATVLSAAPATNETINRFENTLGWNAISGTFANSAVIKVEGADSVYMTTLAPTSILAANVTLPASADLSSVFQSVSGTPNSGKLYIWLREDAGVERFAAGDLQIRIGNDDGNYLGFSFNPSTKPGWALNSWTLIELNAPDGTVVGNPDWTTTNYLRFQTPTFDGGGIEKFYMDFMFANRSAVSGTGNSIIYQIEGAKALNISENIANSSHFLFIDEDTFVFFNYKSSTETDAWSCYFANPIPTCNKFSSTEWGAIVPYVRGFMSTSKRYQGIDTTTRGRIISGNPTQLTYDQYTYDIRVKCLDEMVEGRKLFTTTISTDTSLNRLLNQSWGYLIPSSIIGTGQTQVFTTCTNGTQRLMLTGLNGNYTINAYSLNTTLGQYYTFNIQNALGLTLGGSVISAYRFSPLNSIWVTIEQALTDSQGTGVLFLEPLASYKLIITKPGYNTENINLTPAGITTINIKLYPSNGSSPEIPAMTSIPNVTFSVTPSNSYSNNITTIEYTVSTPVGDIEYYGWNVYKTINGTTTLVASQNITTNPYGGIVNYTANDNATYSIQPFVKLLNLPAYIFNPQNYKIGSKSSFQFAQEIMAGASVLSGWAFYFIGIVISMLVVGYVSRFSFEGAGIAGLVVLWMFTLFMPTAAVGGFTAIAITSITTVATLAVIYAKSQMS